MYLICVDLEGVFSPEIWVSVSKGTGIKELMLTTRDVPDFNKLMDIRLSLLKKHNITLTDIQNIIKDINLLPGAKEFSDWLRSIFQVVIVTDNYIEFIKPIMKKLGYPTAFCHNLEVDECNIISKYCLRLDCMKLKTIQAFKDLNYEIIAIGDSYNDLEMLQEAELGILFRPPNNLIKKYPEFPVAYEYSDLKSLISKHIGLSLQTI
ncbi:MAG: bifunctional phosphoserine phosphatase/homoserine phosphotransferase ThrH [Promethearchaeota archaeon]